jgi:predicted RNase H-like HicB family nuclease
VKYKLPVVITLLEDGQYLANCEVLHAIATGDTPDEAIAALQESITDMVDEFGTAKVFEKFDPNIAPKCP